MKHRRQHLLCRCHGRHADTVSGVWCFSAETSVEITKLKLLHSIVQNLK